MLKFLTLVVSFNENKKLTKQENTNFCRRARNAVIKIIVLYLF